MAKTFEKGFTLLEVLVAFSILSVSLGVFYSTLSSSLGRQAAAGRENEALQLVKNNIAMAGEGIPLRTSTLRGVKGEFNWVLTIRPRPDGKSPLWLYEVISEVHWNDGQEDRDLALTTLKLGPGEDIGG